MSTNNENECAVDGVDYVAVATTGGCDGCASKDRTFDDLCLDLAECRGWVRSDGRTVVWVKK